MERAISENPLIERPKDCPLDLVRAELEPRQAMAPGIVYASPHAGGRIFRCKVGICIDE